MPYLKTKTKTGYLFYLMLHEHWKQVLKLKLHTTGCKITIWLGRWGVKEQAINTICFKMFSLRAVSIFKKSYISYVFVFLFLTVKANWDSRLKICCSWEVAWQLTLYRWGHCGVMWLIRGHSRAGNQDWNLDPVACLPAASPPSSLFWYYWLFITGNQWRTR